MKALVLEEYRLFVYKDVAAPICAPNEVIIDVKACGICGSDVHGMDGSTGRRRPPIIMGHEAAGVISACGPDVTDYTIGDRVTFDSTIYCGACAFCKQGRVNLCDNRMVLGVSCADYRRHGAFAEQVAVPAHILYRLPDGLSFEKAAMVEALSVAVHAVSRAGVPHDEPALVLGAGMIGLLIIQTLRAKGCTHIIVADIDEARLAMAREFGASTTLVVGKQDLLKEVRALTNGLGVAVAYDAVGSIDTPATVIEATRKGGSVGLVGNLSASANLPLQSAVTREISIYGSCASAGEYPECLDLIASGAVDVNTLISATPPLSEGPHWFDRLYRKEPGLMKIILRP